MNILLVEDTKTIIKGLTYAFEQEGFNLISKSSVRETKEYLLNNKNINLAILDITLPDGNGFDLYKSTIKELNIAFEYDEPKHYVDVYNNILCEKDIKRQEEIINELKCKFYRYNEKLDKLYLVGGQDG